MREEENKLSFKKHVAGTAANSKNGSAIGYGYNSQDPDVRGTM